jgi:hypothetical protein
VLALARLVFEFAGALEGLVGRLLPAVLLLLRSSSREVVKAVLGFIKVRVKQSARGGALRTRRIAGPLCVRPCVRVCVCVCACVRACARACVRARAAASCRRTRSCCSDARTHTCTLAGRPRLAAGVCDAHAC